MAETVRTEAGLSYYNRNGEVGGPVSEERRSDGNRERPVSRSGDSGRFSTEELLGPRVRHHGYPVSGGEREQDEGDRNGGNIVSSGFLSEETRHRRVHGKREGSQ